MKKNTLLTLICICCLTALQAQLKKEKQVAAAVERLRQAMISGNRQQLEALTLPQLSYGHSSGAVDDQRQFVEKIGSGASDFVSIELAEQTITISGKTALVRHQLKATTNDGGKPGTVHLKVLLVWQKKGGVWKLLARQAVRVQV